MASAEVALRFKVGPLNETKNFCLNDIFVGLHLLAGHRFEVRRFVKECVRANLCAPPNLFSERGLLRPTSGNDLEKSIGRASAKKIEAPLKGGLLFRKKTRPLKFCSQLENSQI